MRKKCRHCHKKSQISQIPLTHQSRDSYIRTEYGLARVVEPSKVIFHNDDYMLKQMYQNRAKMKTMQKQIKMLKHRLKKCQRTIDSQHDQNDNIIKSIEQMRKSRLKTYTNGQQSSRTQTVSNSRKRQIGRFTRLADRQSLPSSHDQEIGNQYIKKKKFQIPCQLRKSRKSKQSALQYSQDDQQVIVKFLPQRQEYVSKKSSLLLSKNFQQEISTTEKERLNHQLDELIIEEKNTQNAAQKRSIRKQIGLISKKLACLQSDFA